MGDIKKKRKQFRRPKKLFDSQRIEEENKIIKKYGLKNKKEIWKAETQISKFRRRAKELIPKSEEEKKELYEKLNKLGIEVKELSDVLGLTKENWLDRRLQTIVLKKGFVKNPRGARQLIVHKHVLVDGKIVNRPSFVVTTELEGKVSLKPGKVKEKKVKVEKKETQPVEEQDGEGDK